MSVRFEETVLHIGAAKTGTTSIQAFLAENRDLLADRGILYPRSPGGKNHVRLRQFVSPSEKDGADAKTLADRLKKDLKGEVEAFLPKTGTVSQAIIFSNEHLHGSAQTEAQLRALKALLGQWSRNFRIVLYIRRQDLTAVSFYSTALKAGFAPDKFRFVNRKKDLPYVYDYYKAYSLWKSVFDSVEIRLFDPAEFVGGTLIEDFCKVAGIQWSADFKFPEPMNTSLDATGAYLLTLLNRKLQGQPTKLSHQQLQLLRDSIYERCGSGPRFRPARASAKAFYSAFEASNEMLRKAAFPERSTPLFADDFSMYPESETSLERLAQVDVAAEVLIEAWLRCAATSGVTQGA